MLDLKELPGVPEREPPPQLARKSLKSGATPTRKGQLQVDDSSQVAIVM